MANQFIGRRIVRIRPMTKKELDLFGWDNYRTIHINPIIVLDNGAKIVISQDEEGNGPGFVFGINKSGKSVYIPNIFKG